MNLFIKQALLLLFLSGLVRGAESKNLVVVAPGDYRPFALELSGRWNGIDIQLLREFSTSRKLNLEIRRTTWKDLAKDLKTADLAAGGVTITSERQAIGPFTQAYYRGGKQALIRCKDTKKFSSLAKADRKGIRFVTNIGGTNEKFTRANVSKAKILSVNENLKAFEKIKDSEADIMITDGIEAEYYSNNSPDLCIGFSGKKLTSFELGFWFKEKGELYNDFDQWLGEQIKAGRTGRMVSQAINKTKKNCNYGVNCECTSPGATRRWEEAYCLQKLKLKSEKKNVGVLAMCIKNSQPRDYSKMTACEKNRVWRKKICKNQKIYFGRLEDCLTSKRGVPAYIMQKPKE